MINEGKRKKGYDSRVWMWKSKTDIIGLYKTNTHRINKQRINFKKSEVIYIHFEKGRIK